MDIKIKNILAVGLGSMGFGIAQSLIRAGYSVYGQDKNLKQQKRLIEEGGYDKNIPFNDLQAVIAQCRASDLDVPLQFINMK